MKRTLELLPRVEVELSDAVAWYESRRAGLGDELLDVARESFARVQGSPHTYPRWVDARPHRRLVVPRFPYVVFFTFGDGRRVDRERLTAVPRSRRLVG